MNEAAMWAERDAIARLVEESPTTITIERSTTPLKDDGTGRMIEDRNAVKTINKVSMRIRIAHDRKQPAVSDASHPGVFSTNNNRIATWAWNTDIKEGETFRDEDLDKTFAFRDVDVLRLFGGVVGYQAALIQAGE